ncbi:MAG TPA: hypothetical protein VGX78_22510 [Pirellulales bacterium]|jgi:hypothetical protein|nr:hypothetical protein [Pirellulales bacterium]
MPDENDSNPALAVSPSTIGRAAHELVGVEMPDADQKAVAELTANLFAEMASLRAFDVGETEPATIYRADAE